MQGRGRRPGTPLGSASGTPWSGIIRSSFAWRRPPLGLLTSRSPGGSHDGCFRAGWRWSGAFLVALYPLAWQYDGLLYPESLATTLTLGILIVVFTGVATLAALSCSGCCSELRCSCARRASSDPGGARSLALSDR